MKKIIFSILLFFPFISHADIYVWTDDQNIVHYSDVPASGAKPMKLASVQSYSPLSSSMVTSTVTAVTAEHVYKYICITSPDDQATIVNKIQGDITVNVDLRPTLKLGDQIQLLLDGKVVSSQKYTSFKLKDIDRGAHTLLAQIINVNNKILITSSSVTFYMQRPMKKQVKG